MSTLSSSAEQDRMAEFMSRCRRWRCALPAVFAATTACPSTHIHEDETAGPDQTQDAATSADAPVDAEQAGEAGASAAEGGVIDIPPGALPGFEPEARCTLPLEPGDCDQAIQRFYYSYSGARRCEPFTYTGCGGNENNFESGQECVSACGIPAPCGCVDATAQCDPSRCDLCPAVLAYAQDEPCEMIGLECRGDEGSHCNCIEDETGASRWDCEIFV